MPKTSPHPRATAADHADAIRLLSRRVRALAAEVASVVQAVQELEGRVGDLEVKEEEGHARR